MVVTADGDTDQKLGDLDIQGYLLIQADSLDEAVKIASQAPNVAGGGSAVVRPVVDIGMG